MKFLKPASLAIAFFAVSSAHAATFETNFTGDNFVTGFEYTIDGATTTYALDQSGTKVENSSDNTNFNWRDATTLTIGAIDNGSNYEFIWTTEDAGGTGGFLADFTLNGTEYLSSDSSIWEVSTDGTNWVAASIVSTDPWGSNAPKGAGEAIDGNAQWIWSADAQNDNLVYVKASITSAVPEPSTYALMLGGLGLVGFMAARRRKTA